jgi:Transglutaminase-like superfamily
VIDSFLEHSNLIDFERLREDTFLSAVSGKTRSVICNCTPDCDIEKHVNSVYQLLLSFPYRYASAELRASQVLLQGMGMCTNKAVASVALLRLACIRAGFLILRYRNTAHRTKLMNSEIANRIKPYTIHVAPVVWFHDRWVPFDASDDLDTARLIHDYDPPVEWLGQDLLCIDVGEVEANLGVWPNIESLVKDQKWTIGDFDKMNAVLETQLHDRRNLLTSR